MILQAPYIVVKTIPNVYNLEIPQNQRKFWYGQIEIINYATLVYQPGDIVLFKLEDTIPVYTNNGLEYFVISEASIYYIAQTPTTRIFDYTFEFTFE